ncbi:UDP-glucuronosyltransferase 1-6 [Melipona quadrifasciata]|uniref:UDP-glucuronosyltransferase n=1 Tax=Melipona quadrifasciata TaxID=166423 RepID=A0A0M8ZMW9_9HYME|nr:UDP-glucuronosyltransferase 1-6 [Melipona quadrifasciata]
MKRLEIVFLLLMAVLVCVNDAYRILCVFPYNGKSHFRMSGVLCKGLAKKGHKVDMISHFPTKIPIANYSDIVDLNGTRKDVVNRFSVQYGRTLHAFITYYIATRFGGDLCHLLGHERMQNFIKNPPKDPPYDLVITEYFGASCYLGLGAVLNAPVAIVLTSLETSYVDSFMGNPFNFAFFPGTSLDNAVLNTFFDRVWNLVVNYKDALLFYRYTSDQTNVMRKHLGWDLPDVRQLERNVTLALVSSHYSFHGIRSFAPAMIEVGGLHIQDKEIPLSRGLKNWLDEADHGLVYFTMGSLLNIESLPRDTLLGLYASFGKISPIRVLMRIANATKLPPGLPDNVVVSSWIPQISVLKHKNTRVFITHGGLMGTEEAVYYGIPTIGIPVCFDQMRNVNIMVHKKMGVLLRLEDLSERSMDTALHAILHDPKYREAARKMSQLFRDRPMNSLDTAIYWTEYVIRNGPDSLKSPAVDMPWWKLHLIDVFVFLIASFVLALYFLFVAVKFTLKNLYTLKNKRPKEKSN